MKDTLNAYLQLRGHVEEAGGQRMALLKNPILFSDQKLLATLDPKNVQTLEVPSAQIPEGALVTTGSDKFLHEVRAYSDVPMRRRVQSIAKKEFDESKHPRDKEGKFTEGGMIYAPDSEYLSRTKEYIEATFVSQYQTQQWQRSRGEGPVTPIEEVPLEALKAQATTMGRAMLARAIPTVRVPAFVAEKILEDGRFKSQHESGRSGGVLDPAYRAEAEQTMFGTDPTGDVTKRPIYGVFIEDFAEARYNQARTYGEVIFVLKDSILDRTTVSFSDSLADSYHAETIAPRPYREFDWVGTGATGHQLTNANSVDKLFSYAEAQFHGGVTLEDVKDVMVNNDRYLLWQSSGTLAKFKEKGIAVRVITPGPHKARI